MQMMPYIRYFNRSLSTIARYCTLIVNVDAESASGQQEERIGGSGFLHTLFNSVNVLCGVGLLTTPYAAAKMGWLSILLLFGLGTHSRPSCFHRCSAMFASCFALCGSLHWY